MVERPTLSTVLAEKGFRGALFVAGEVLFIARPLIYVAFIRKYGIRSWIPWVLSLAVDFMGMGILSQVTTQDGGKKEKIHLSAPEQQEVRALKPTYYVNSLPFWSILKLQAKFVSIFLYDQIKRRKLLWAFYLMRDPFFSKYTR